MQPLLNSLHNQHLITPIISLMSITSDLDSYLISDDILAAAYSGTTLKCRAWMKKQTAHLCTHYGLDGHHYTRSLQHRASAFSRTSMSRPVDYAGLIIDSSPPAWNKLLALLVPAAMQGSTETGVFVLSDNPEAINPELLTAMELAGIEDIYCLDMDTLQVWLSRQGQNPECLFFSCSRDFNVPDKGNHPFNRRRWLNLPAGNTYRAAVWADKNHDWDWDALAWANPDVYFLAAGEKAGQAPEGFEILDVEPGELKDLEVDVFFGPEEYFRESRARLGLSPGLEACWVWPGLDRHFFSSRREFWAGMPAHRKDKP